MKRTAILATALCLSLIATGCAANQNVPASESTDTTASETTETEITETTAEESTAEESAMAETSKETITETSTASHVVKFEEVILFSSEEGSYVFQTVVPKLIVDGKEATEINNFLSDHIKKTYPLEMNGKNADGMSTKLSWGAKDNIVSIIIMASDTSTDYTTCEVFNFDLDTLKAIDDSEVTKRLGMTDEGLFGKVTDILNEYCKPNEDKFSAYDLDRSLVLINYDKITPIILPDGSVGVAVTVVYSEQTQFYGLETVRLLNL